MNAATVDSFKTLLHSPWVLYYLNMMNRLVNHYIMMFLNVQWYTIQPFSLPIENGILSRLYDKVGVPEHFGLPLEFPFFPFEYLDYWVYWVANKVSEPGE